MLDDPLKQTVFELVRDRLIANCDSLERFMRHWQGRASGIEGWFRVEFAAAIDPTVAIVRSGGAGGHGKTSVKCSDFILEPKVGNSRPVPVELKAAGGWWTGGTAARDNYAGHLLAFLAMSHDPLLPTHKKYAEALDSQIQIARICRVQLGADSRAFYLGLADLRR